MECFRPAGLTQEIFNELGYSLYVCLHIHVCARDAKLAHALVLYMFTCLCLFGLAKKDVPS